MEASETVHGKSEGKEEQKRGCLPLDEVNWSCVIEWWRGSMLRDVSLFSIGSRNLIECNDVDFR